MSSGGGSTRAKLPSTIRTNSMASSSRRYTSNEKLLQHQTKRQAKLRRVVRKYVETRAKAIRAVKVKISLMSVDAAAHLNEVTNLISSFITDHDPLILKTDTLAQQQPTNSRNKIFHYVASNKQTPVALQNTKIEDSFRTMFARRMENQTEDLSDIQCTVTSYLAYNELRKLDKIRVRRATNVESRWRNYDRSTMESANKVLNWIGMEIHGATSNLSVKLGVPEYLVQIILLMIGSAGLQIGALYAVKQFNATNVGNVVGNIGETVISKIENVAHGTRLVNDFIIAPALNPSSAIPMSPDFTTWISRNYNNFSNIVAASYNSAPINAALILACITYVMYVAGGKLFGYAKSAYIGVESFKDYAGFKARSYVENVKSAYGRFRLSIPYLDYILPAVSKRDSVEVRELKMLQNLSSSLISPYEIAEARKSAPLKYDPIDSMIRSYFYIRVCNEISQFANIFLRIYVTNTIDNRIAVFNVGVDDIERNALSAVSFSIQKLSAAYLSCIQSVTQLLSFIIEATHIQNSGGNNPYPAGFVESSNPTKFIDLDVRMTELRYNIFSITKDAKVAQSLNFVRQLPVLGAEYIKPIDKMTLCSNSLFHYLQRLLLYISTQRTNLFGSKK